MIARMLKRAAILSVIGIPLGLALNLYGPPPTMTNLLIFVIGGAWGSICACVFCK